jgi:hypothetical protein
MTGKGYDKTCPITPYIHILIYHVPDMLIVHDEIPFQLFTGQGNTNSTRFEMKSRNLDVI